MADNIAVEVNDQQTALVADTTQIAEFVRDVLQGEGVRAAEVSVALVDDAAIHRLNRQFLDHDYATDVLSFPLHEEDGYLEGEIVVSAEMAARKAHEYNWLANDELLLYLVHGCLHLAGYDDASDSQRQEMREAEAKYLGRLGLKPRYDE